MTSSNGLKLRSMLGSDEYDKFRSTVALKRVVVEEDQNKVWSVYDTGPKCVTCPLVFLPPVSGVADVFYKQLLALCVDGYHVIALDYPAYWTIQSFCHGLSLLLAHLGYHKVHLFGASLGGYLAQKYAELYHSSSAVQSLILCNAFCDTTIFDRNESSSFYWTMPAVFLRRIVLGGFPRVCGDLEISDSIRVMTDSLNNLSQQQLASRMTLNCAKSQVDVAVVGRTPTTIIDVYDVCALSPEARDTMHKAYPTAKIASLKTGGNFPYLSRSAEVNTFIRIHLKQFESTDYSANANPG